ncbi:MAG: hypothetical protein II844_10250 [Prevotella sp.]|nr:hypothetical protein [Prevotella sp.]MBR6191500.1 hypothetical protein [Prevotella sp.]
MSEIRKLRYRLFSWRSYPKLTPSAEPIDVVIPIIAKDLRILPLCLEGVRHCVANKICKIYIVAPDQKEIRMFCDEHKLEFVDECAVFGYSPKSLNLITAGGLDRSGWLFQQFVKLSGNVGTCRHYLCIDADHVLVYPHVFLTSEGKTVFYQSYEEHLPYYDMIQRLLPGMEISRLSYVDHKMLFDKQKLAKLQQAISENGGGKPWTEVVLDKIDRSTHAGFSEFETYGNFVSDDEKVLRPWLQKRLPYSKIADYDTLRRRYGSKRRWAITFPDYMKQNQK